MTEVIFNTIVYGPSEVFESIELCIPIPILIAHDASSLNHKISSSSKPNDSRLKRYFVLLLESIGKDADYFYTKMEENPEVLTIFNVANENFINSPPFKQTKLYNIPKESITIVLTLSYIQFLKSEADKNVKLDQTALSKIYLRKAEKTKEWLMSNLRVC
jgi:hypothetical protein